MFDTGPGLYLATSAFMLVGFSWYQKYWANRPHGPPLPPGPPSLPLFGSIFSLDDPTRPFLAFNTLKSTYGDIIYARLLTKPVVVINSEKVARDLELRSIIYSDKPQSIVYEPFACDFNVGLMPYGDRWRLHRRIFQQSFRQASIPTRHAVLLRSARKMLFGFLEDPTSYSNLFNKFTSSFIVSIVYAYEPKDRDDHVVDIMKEYADLAVMSLGPGATMVMEAFPFLLRLPAWFPGAIFKRNSVKCLQAGHDVKEIPFQRIKDRISNGEMPPCVVTDAMNSMNGFDNGVIETAIKEAACIAFGATQETTGGTLLVFLLAMVLYPEVQAKAQAEIDQVIGKDRLPDFDDRPALPFVEAVMRETLRWHPVLPMGIPHATTADDIYNSYFIPKGVVVIFNTWAMTHDETKYPNPTEFKPERFLHEDGSLTSDKMLLGFGWGRRVCVGRHLADAAVWIAMANLLAAFSFHKALDEHGQEIPVTPVFSTGVAVHPENFPCRIVPRFRDGSVERLKQLTDLDSLQ